LYYVVLPFSFFSFILLVLLLCCSIGTDPG